MNQETEQNINATLKWVAETADESKGFVLEQAPLYAQEVVAWAFIQGAIMACTMWVFTLATLVIAYKIYKAGKKADYDQSMIMFGSGLVGVVAAVLFMGGACGVKKMLKAKYAPRVLIVEHIRGVVK